MKMFIPIYKHGITNHYPSWFSHELKHATRKKLTDITSRRRICSERALAKRLYRRDHENHSQSVESGLKKNPRRFWKSTRNLSNKKKTAQKITLTVQNLSVVRATSVKRSQISFLLFLIPWEVRLKSAPCRTRKTDTYQSPSSATTTFLRRFRRRHLRNRLELLRLY